jgi:ABC-type multidrug transport system permease subunit
MLLSALFSDLATSMQMSIGSFYPNLLLSGILWPVEGMPWYLRGVAWYLPCTAACQAMRDVMARGWNISKDTVYMGYIMSTIWIIIFLALSWVTIKVKSN